MGIEKLSSLSIKRPLITVFLWVILIAVSSFVIFRFLGDALTTEQSVSVEIESDKAEQLLAERLGTSDPVTELVIVKSERYKVDSPEFRDFTLKLQDHLARIEDDVVDSTVSFFQTQNTALVSKNQDATIIITNLSGSLSEAEENIEKISEVVAEADENSDFQVLHAGAASINKGFQEVAESDLQQAEFLGIPIAIVILILVFGAVAAAFLPIILSFLAITLAVATTAIFGQFSNLSFFVTNMITMMGLAVGIDYSLFVVSRFREERGHGVGKLAAIVRTAATASRAVFFSGVTVVVALAGLLLVPSNIFRSLSLGAIFVVIAAVFATLTLLPAILAILGDKINFLKIPFLHNTGAVEENGSGFWQKLAGTVMRFPVWSVAISAAILILCTVPVLGINIGNSGVESLPDNLEAKEGFVILQNEFASGLLSPTQIVISGNVGSEQVKEQIANLEVELKNTAYVGSVATQSYPDKDLAVTTIVFEKNGPAVTAVIEDIRELPSIQNLRGHGTTVLVGGQDAQQADFTQIIREYTPIVFAFVLTLSFLFLMLVFRSIVVPIKAIIMNLLSVGAAYGLLVLVFQKGVGADLLGFQQTDQIESWIPLFLFAILFGLSMDYHVFLLSRIREKFLQTGDNTRSVIFGLATTGRLITGAALIMVAVFSGFAAGELSMFEQVGFGLAISILLDATIIRCILVPASMKLLGNWNWYLPSWLSWLPKIGIEG